MAVRYTKARYFSFIIYPESIPDNWKDCLTKLGLAMAVSPLHDSDEKKDPSTWDDNNDLIINGKHYKKPHYHVLYIAKNPVTVESVRKKIKRVLGVQAVSHMEIIDSVENTFKYLTHESKDAIAKNKHIYDKSDITYINDFDIDRYITLDEGQKRELKNTLLEIIQVNNIVNVSHLFEFLEFHGSEYGISKFDKSFLHDTISANSSAFRLYFDANYQDGYRHKIKPKFDKDTGEILEDKGEQK
jgi:hypothetical protein